MVKGIAAIGALGVLTVLCWIVSTPVPALPALDEVSQLFGGLALTGFAAMMVLSTRIWLLDTLFTGLDKSYVVHKWLAIVAVALVAVHFTLRFSLMAAEHAAGGPRRDMTPGLGQFGVPAFVMFLVLGGLTLVWRRLNYDIWKLIHKFMALPYAVGLIHFYGSSGYPPLAPFSLWLDLLTVIGVGSALYSIFLYESVAFRYRYHVTNLRPLGKGNLEITAATTGRTLPFTAGQFAFVKVPSRRFTSHPFSLSAAPGDQTVQFVVGALGDDTTRLTGALEVGDELRLTKAHGRFDYRKGRPNQVWVAAGVGVAPFRSFLEAGVPEGFSIDLFYSYRGDQAAYLDDLASVATGVRLHLIDTSQQGRLTAEQIAAAVPADKPIDVYFCGPKPMRAALKRGLKASGPKRYRFHYEEFTFGR